MSAPAPPPPPPPPPSKSNRLMHYFDLPSELKWASKEKSSADPTHRGRHHKAPYSTKKKPSSSTIVIPTSQLPRKSYNRPWLEGELAKESSGSSFEGSSSLQIDIPDSRTPFHGPSSVPEINNSESDISFLNFIMPPSDSTSVENKLVNSKAITLQKFQKECSSSGMHIEIENNEQKHGEDVNKEEKHVEDEDKEKEMQVEIENSGEKKDEVGKEGKEPKIYLRRFKMRGKEVINEEIEMQIPVEEKEVTVDEKDKPEMDATPVESNETVAKTWNLRPRKSNQRPQNVNVNTNESAPLKVGGGSEQTNKDKQPKEDSENEQGGGGDKKKGQQKKNKCKKNGKGKQEKFKDMGQEGNETLPSKLPKLSLQLSEEEIAEDLFAMTGARPSRKPKRRSKNAQREIELLTPGSYLDSITPDSYKVEENTGKGK